MENYHFVKAKSNKRHGFADIDGKSRKEMGTKMKRRMSHEES